MHDSSSGILEPSVTDAIQLARTAWDHRESDPRHAIQLARAAIRERPGAAASGLAWASVAVASANMNEPEEARTAADQVPQLLNEAGGDSLPDRAAILVETSLALLRAAFLLGELTEGVRAGRQALEQAQSHGLAALEARAHTGLGALFGSRGMSSTALKHMRSGLTVLEANELPVPPILLNNLGNVYFNTGGADEALGFYTKARQRFLADGDLFRASLARSNEGRALMALERLDEAVEALEEGVSLLDQVEDRAYYAAALSKAGSGHAKAGNRQRAEACFIQALREKADLGGQDPFEDEIRRQYADFLRQEGRREEALQQYQAALDLARAGQKLAVEVEVLECSAALLAEMGRFEQAYVRLRAYVEARGRLEEESGDLLLRHQLIDLEAEVGATHELSLVARMAMADANRELLERTRRLQDLSATDDLTQLFNRRYFRSRLDEEEALAAMNQRDLALLLIDVDHFKSVNDRFSHSVGDAVLVEFAGLLRKAFRVGDVVARWGGEEFAVLLPGFDLETAGVVAERARQLIEAHDWEEYGAGLSVTASIGIAGLAELDSQPDATARRGRHEALLDLADSRLYDAKRLGRNRVVRG